MNTGYGVSAQTGYPYAAASYPVDVQYPVQQTYNKFYAIPVVGLVWKEILLIPHLIILYVLTMIVGVLQLVLWIPVLFTGRYPQVGHMIVGGHLSWQTRVAAYLLGLSDQYPAFSLVDPGGTAESHMLLQPSTTASRLYAIPILGFLVKNILLIPHFIILYVLAAVCGVVMLVSWIPVLLNGTYPSWAMTMVGGTLRWFTRCYAYYFGLTDQYPPFQLGS